MMDEKVTINVRGLGLIGLLGGLGGAINAWLCYVRFPVPVMEPALVTTAQPYNFAWHVVPAGAVHGACLALVSIAVATILRHRSVSVRLLFWPLVGWSAGWLAWVPLEASLDESWWPLSDMVELNWGLLVWPLQFFGLVGVLYYGVLNLHRGRNGASLPTHVRFGILSGVLGSLWFWIAIQPWYFSLLHGTIWGCLVGFGVWKSQQSPKTSR